MTTPKEEYPANWEDRIIKDPQILAGKPVIKGTRISVELITDFLGGGVWTEGDILKSYPGITLEDIDACVRYKATGAKLSNVTWADIDAWMDDADRARETWPQPATQEGDIHSFQQKPASTEANDMATPQEKHHPNWQDRIEKNPQILAGKPVIKGTRISVELITDFLDGVGCSKADLLEDYPGITLEDIDACVRYKATGAKLSNVTWADIDAMMDESDRARGLL